MADINVERKKTSVWPWIIGLIVLALLVWALTEMLSDRGASETPVVVEEPAAEVLPQPSQPTSGSEPAGDAGGGSPR